LALAASQDLEIHQLDIKTAFLNGELEKDVWTQQPPGYETDDGIACHLHKSLYGLKQAPRAWHAKLKEELEALGFTPSAADPALFIKFDTNPIYLLTYVDDILVVTGDTTALIDTKTKIMSTFEARDLGTATCFLGMDIHRDRDAHTITLAQGRLTTDLLDQHGMTECKPLITPLSTATKLTKDGEPLDTSTSGYSQLIGSLMYLSVCTRPDIAQAVGALARYMTAPTLAHWQAAKGILRYISGTASYGITFGGNGLTLEAYCDADYAGDIDTRRSTTGYVFTLGGGAISWSSRLQPTVAASTTEAEYMAAAYAIKEALWLRTLLSELGLDTGTITICADSQSAIKLLKNPVFSMCSKHIDVIYHFARERVTRKDVAFKYIPTDKMAADALTKPLPSTKFNFCRTAMGIGGIDNK
jgi:ribonuclease HI